MKISKGKLRQIIREELNEYTFGGGSMGGHASSNVRGSGYGSGPTIFELEEYLDQNHRGLEYGYKEITKGFIQDRLGERVWKSKDEAAGEIKKFIDDMDYLSYKKSERR